VARGELREEPTMAQGASGSARRAARGVSTAARGVLGDRRRLWLREASRARHPWRHEALTTTLDVGPRRCSALYFGVGLWPRGALGDRSGEEHQGDAQPSALDIGPRLRSARKSPTVVDPASCGGGGTLNGLDGPVDGLIGPIDVFFLFFFFYLIN
jgi:hypothetical protein